MAHSSSPENNADTRVQIGTYEYDSAQQLQEVMDNLKTNLEKLREKNIHLQCIEQLKKKDQDPDIPADKNVAALELLEKNIKILQERAEKYESPFGHFTKEYRTLEGYCGKYQTDLDKIDVSTNPELRRRRKECLKNVESTALRLTKKAHSDGQICPGCEIKE